MRDVLHLSVGTPTVGKKQRPTSSDGWVRIARDRWHFVMEGSAPLFFASATHRSHSWLRHCSRRPTIVSESGRSWRPIHTSNYANDARNDREGTGRSPRNCVVVRKSWCSLPGRRRDDAQFRRTELATCSCRRTMALIRH